MARRPHHAEHATRGARRIGARRSRLALYTIAALAALVVAGGATTPVVRMPPATQPPTPCAPSAAHRRYGPNTGLHLNANFVGHRGAHSRAPATGSLRADGGVFARGDGSRSYGSMGGQHAEQADRRHRGDAERATATGSSPPTAACSRSATAGFHGSLGSHKQLNAPDLAIASTRTGNGLLAARRRRRRVRLRRRRASTARRVDRRTARRSSPWRPTPSGRGYYLLGADGGVFTFGNARFAGSAVDGHLATGIAVLAQRRATRSPAPTAASSASAASRRSRRRPTWTANQHPVIAIAPRGAAVVRGWRGATHRRRRRQPKPVAGRPLAGPVPQVHPCARVGHCRRVPGGEPRRACTAVRTSSCRRRGTTSLAHIGRHDLVGVDPAAASPHDQDVARDGPVPVAGLRPRGATAARDCASSTHEVAR